MALDMVSERFCEKNFTEGKFLCKETNCHVPGNPPCTSDSHTNGPRCQLPPWDGWHSFDGNSGYDGCNCHGMGLWSSALDVNIGNNLWRNPATKDTELLEQITALAADRFDLDTRGGWSGEADDGTAKGSCDWLFVAHKNMNLTRIFQKGTGEYIGAIAMPMPHALARHDGGLWAIIASLTRLPTNLDGKFGGFRTTVATEARGLAMACATKATFT